MARRGFLSGGGDAADMASELANRARAMSRSWKLLREREASQRNAQEEEQPAERHTKLDVAAPTQPPKVGDHQSCEDVEGGDEVWGRPISFFELLEEIRECPYTTERYPLLLDPSGRAARFLRYRGRLLQAVVPGDLEPERLRRGLTQCLHHGACLVLDFHDLPNYDLDALFAAQSFPREVLDPRRLFDPAVYGPCLRQDDCFPPRVAATEELGWASAAPLCYPSAAVIPERPVHALPAEVAIGLNEDFELQESFRLVVVCSSKKVPHFLRGRLAPLAVDGAAPGARHAGRSVSGIAQKDCCAKLDRPAVDMALLAAAYDGHLAEVHRLLNLRADARATDGRGNDALSEAAVKGHLEVVEVLLAHQAPLGTNPNSTNSDGRSCLHRAAFHGHVATVQLLLRHGADPRLRTHTTGERAFDVSLDQETLCTLEAWDIAETDRLCLARREAQEAEEERMAVDAEDRRQLELRRKTQHLFGLVEQGEVDVLETELLGLPRGREVNSLRDTRGNAALHIAAERNRLECAEVLVEVGGARVDVREGKGWTPLAIAAFRGFKRMCAFLLAKGADPHIPNAYRRCAHDLAKDEEVAELLRRPPEIWRPLREQAAEDVGLGDAQVSNGIDTAADACTGLVPGAAAGSSAQPDAAGSAGRGESKSKGKPRRPSAAAEPAEGATSSGSSAAPAAVRRKSAKRRTL